MKDSIDFGSMDISTLFRKLLVPTVLGMVFSAIFVITDGIFVGKGIGSDALAAVNITAPLFMIAAGIGLMFGVGGLVVASIHLSQGKRKAANINITQALVFSAILILIMSALCFYFVEPLGRFLGSSDKLLPYVIEYMSWYVPFLVFYEILNIGMFYIRLDGSPNYAMMCNATAAILNILLNYIFIFEFGWGMMGAAFATSLGTVVGGLMTLVYLMHYSHDLRLYRIKLSRKSLRMTFRNIGYMVKLGNSAFVSEASIACMMFLGNYVFIRNLGEDGVAAFSIVCYFFPIIFMVYNAIAQSAQPIISYNYGAGQYLRVRQGIKFLTKIALLYTSIAWCILDFFPEFFIHLFNSEEEMLLLGVPALHIYFLGFFMMAFQSAGQTTFISLGMGKYATFFSLFRKVILVIPLTIFLPNLWDLGVYGVFYAEMISNFVGGIACFSTMMMVVWRRLGKLNK